MKWFLFILACVCLYFTVEMGLQVKEIQTSLVGVEIEAGYVGGALGAAILGAASVLGAAYIQVSENRSK